MNNIKNFFYKLFKKIKKNILKRDKNINKNLLIKSNLIECSKNNIVINNNIEITNNHNDEYKNNLFNFIKCKNYNICNNILPKIWYQFNNIEICDKCNYLFGKWRGGKGILNELNDFIKCPICLEYKKCVSQPKCEHYLCIDCIKRCYYGIYENRENYIPSFPYSEKIKKEYEIDPNNIKWNTDYPLIKHYLDEVNMWYEVFLKYKNEKYLRRCYLCRN